MASHVCELGTVVADTFLLLNQKVGSNLSLPHGQILSMLIKRWDDLVGGHHRLGGNWSKGLIRWLPKFYPRLTRCWSTILVQRRAVNFYLMVLCWGLREEFLRLVGVRHGWGKLILLVGDSIY